MMGARWFSLIVALAAPVGVAGAQARASMEPAFTATRDSDGNLGTRLGLAFEAPAAGSTFGVEASRWQVEDGVDRVQSYGLGARALYRPGRTVRVEGVLGGVLVDLSGPAPSERVLPTGRVRIRLSQPGGMAIDLRARRGLIDGSPDLLANLVVRNELGATLDLPSIGPIKVRGTGRVAALVDRLDQNVRTAVGGMLVLAVAPTVEVSGQVHAIAYDHVSTAGYFAPRLVQMAQLGSYGELEGGAVTLAYEAAAGVQRLADGAVPLGAWRGAGSLWSQLGIRIARGTELRLELEFYDSPAAALVASGGWKYGSAGVSLRQEL